MSLTVELRDASGASSSTVALDADWFGVEPNVAVLHQVITAQLAAARAGTQSTKTRAEVSGGGKKPFKQKGTGRARQGSERAPHFTGGGIALGPKPRSYRQRTPRKMINLALRSALSDRHADGHVVVVDRWGWSGPSTKSARAALEALGVDGRVLVVLSRDDVEAYKSFRNLPAVQVLFAGELNAYDVLCSDWVLFTSDTLPGERPSEEAVAAVAERLSAVVDAAPVATDEPDAVPAATDEPDAAPAATDESDAAETTDTDESEEQQ